MDCIHASPYKTSLQWSTWASAGNLFAEVGNEEAGCGLQTSVAVGLPVELTCRHVEVRTGASFKSHSHISFHGEV